MVGWMMCFVYFVVRDIHKPFECYDIEIWYLFSQSELRTH